MSQINNPIAALIYKARVILILNDLVDVICFFENFTYIALIERAYQRYWGPFFKVIGDKFSGPYDVQDNASFLCPCI